MRRFKWIQALGSRMHPDDLIELGFSQNEAKVYLALLKIGSSSTGPVIKESGLYRVMVYDVLAKLLQKGLVHYSISRNRRVFEAEDPQKILELLRQKEEAAKAVVLQLRRLKVEPKQEKAVLVYEGWTGIKAAQENYFKEMRRGAGGEYLMVGASRQLHERLDAFFNYFHERRSKLGIPAKLLFNKNNRQFGRLKLHYRPVQVRFMPKGTVTPSWISIYKDMVLIGVSEDAPMAMFVKNNAVAESYRQYFNWMWEKAG